MKLKSTIITISVVLLFTVIFFFSCRSCANAQELAEGKMIEEEIKNEIPIA